jgi:mersacidin/lichenicidin family type 2 lantibiotic
MNIIRAWKDEEYRMSLSDEERSLLPDNPAGPMELSDAELDSIVGGGGGGTRARSGGGALYDAPASLHDGAVVGGAHCRSRDRDEARANPAEWRSSVASESAVRLQIPHALSVCAAGAVSR